MKNKTSRRFKKTRFDINASLTTREGFFRMEGSFDAPRGERSKNAFRLPLVLRSPGKIKFLDRYFSLSREGLYRFCSWGRVKYPDPLGRPEIIDPEKSSRAVVLFMDDILSLIGSIAVLTVHGHSHDRASHAEKLEKMKTGAIAMTCGSIAAFLCELLSGLGWKTRLVNCLRTEGIYDTYDCGHVLFEFFWPGKKKWVLADADTHKMFLDERGEYLSLAELRERADAGRPFILEELAPQGLGLIDTTEPVGTGFCGMSQFDFMMLDARDLKRWYSRMLAAVSLDRGKTYLCRDKASERRLKAYLPGAECRGAGQWLETHYGREDE